MAIQNPFSHLSKTQVYLVIGGSTIIMGYYVYHHHSTTGSWNPFSSTASTTTTSAGNPASIDPVTGMAYSQDNVTDPITGQTYLAEADQYGSVAAAEASVSSYGASTASGSGIPVNPASPQPAGSVNTVVGGSVYTSNSAWSQAVQAGLEDVSGSTSYDGADIGTALGLYLTGQPLTSAEANVINVAIAEYGKPPIGSFQIITQPTTTPGKTGTKPGAPVNLRAGSISDTGAQVSWDLPGGVGGVEWHVVNKSSSGTVTDNFVTNNTIALIDGGLTKTKQNTTYTTSVYGSNSAGNGPTATVSWKTK